MTWGHLCFEKTAFGALHGLGMFLRYLDLKICPSEAPASSAPVVAPTFF